MLISELSVRRPVLSIVTSLLLIVFGVMAYFRLPLSEFPDVSAPTLTVRTLYSGASAQIIESKITQLVEDRVSGIEGVRTIDSRTREGVSRVSIEFDADRELDAAANDLRDSLSQVADSFPPDADSPSILKAGMATTPVVRLALMNDQLTRVQLTDYVERFLVDEFSVIDGVADVSLTGARRPAMRVWINLDALTARRLSVTDVLAGLQSETAEYPAGRVESDQREFAVQVAPSFGTPDDFRQLVVGQGDDGHLIRLGEIARVEVAPADDRNENRTNMKNSIGIGISKKSGTNTLDVARKVKSRLDRIRGSLPAGSELIVTMDDSEFIEEAIKQVYVTLMITMILVIGVIYLFLGSWRAVVIPAVTVPISLVASFIVLSALGYSVNLITLLALVLSIGLVVDDSIVVLENVDRRVQRGEPSMPAAVKGSKQVAFAVISTTLVLVAVFAPVMFIGGQIGGMFSELAATISAAVAFSSLVALTLTPVMCSKLLRLKSNEESPAGRIDRFFESLRDAYRRTLTACLVKPAIAAIAVIASLAAIWWLLDSVPREYIPKEDRGMFFVFVRTPDGASLDYTNQEVGELERALMPLVESGEAIRVSSRIPSWGNSSGVQSSVVVVSMAHWDDRPRSTQEAVSAIFPELRAMSGMTAFAVVPSGFDFSSSGNEVEFVIGGTSYEELAHWRDRVVDAASANPNLRSVAADYREQTPELVIRIDKDRAGALGVSVADVGTTLETLLNSRAVATYADRGEQYDVIVQAEPGDRGTPQDLTNIRVRSRTTGRLIPLSNFVSVTDTAGPSTLSRYNRVRAVTLTANLLPGYSLGEAVTFLESVVRDHLPDEAIVDYKGEALKLKESSSEMYWAFGFALLVVFLLLAAQFESFVHPFVITLTVPLAVFGGLLGLYLTDGTLNIYSQIGMIMLVGIATKNGILIIEFANQLRDAGRTVEQAIVDASCIRLRPILMTSISTACGALPLVMASGAGANGRFSLGIVIFSGVLLATLLTLFIVPVFYNVLARYTTSPGAAATELERQERLT